MHDINHNAFGHEVCIIGSQCHCHDVQLNVNAQNKSSTTQYRPTTNHLQICTITEHKNGYWTHAIEAKEITILCDTEKKNYVSIQIVLLKEQCMICDAMFVCKCVLYYCHRVSTQLQLNIYISHIISYAIYTGGLLHQVIQQTFLFLTCTLKTHMCALRILSYLLLSLYVGIQTFNAILTPTKSAACITSKVQEPHHFPSSQSPSILPSQSKCKCTQWVHMY
jgi:hypothetical protein